MSKLKEREFLDSMDVPLVVEPDRCSVNVIYGGWWGWFSSRRARALGKYLIKCADQVAAEK